MIIGLQIEPIGRDKSLSSSKEVIIICNLVNRLKFRENDIPYPDLVPNPGYNTNFSTFSKNYHFYLNMFFFISFIFYFL